MTAPAVCRLRATLGLGSLLLVLHVRYQAVTGLLDGFPEGLGRAPVRIIFYQSRGRRIVDVGLSHPVLGIEHLSDTGCARRAAQPCHRKYLFLPHNTLPF